MTNNYKSGSSLQFDKNWNTRPESNYIHWSPDYPDNQIRLAFKSHFELFKTLEQELNCGKKVIELGAGRGSLSAYYSQYKYDVTLLDTSDEIIERARNIFNHYKLPAKFIVGDATDTKLESNSFDIVVSIGLLEHFENPKDLFIESIRIAKINADIIFYVVPDKITPIQRMFDKINKLLSINKKSKSIKKEDIFRNDYTISYYRKIIEKFNSIKDISGFGVYPLPMISPNRDFPFTLNSSFLERVITIIFSFILWSRKQLLRQNPWICKEENGQAFVIHFRKKV